MKAKLLINGKEIEVNICEEELMKLNKEEYHLSSGYERVNDNECYFYCDGKCYVIREQDTGTAIDQMYYDTANYYSDISVAENNLRADIIMRQLRRYAVTVNQEEVNLKEDDAWVIIYEDGEITPMRVSCKSFGDILFLEEHDAEEAIQKWHDELVWYFTEYKDRL